MVCVMDGNDEMKLLNLVGKWPPYLAVTIWTAVSNTNVDTSSYHSWLKPVHLDLVNLYLSLSGNPMITLL